VKEDQGDQIKEALKPKGRVAGLTVPPLLVSHGHFSHMESTKVCEDGQEPVELTDHHDLPGHAPVHDLETAINIIQA
jgi:hypothetical protein